jgi:hypothetical protein
MGMGGMILAIALVGLIAAADSPTPDPVLDTKFKCPKEYPTFHAYMVDLFAWNDLAKQRHPDWTGQQITDARRNLFVAHHCPAPPAQP